MVAKRKQLPGPSAGSPFSAGGGVPPVGSSSSAGGGGTARVHFKGPESQACAVGEVVSWGAHFVNWTALVAAFTVAHRNIPIDESCKKVLLSVQSSPRSFDHFAPPGTSAPTLAVLRTWYDGNKWKAFEISKPPDFR